MTDGDSARCTPTLVVHEAGSDSYRPCRRAPTLSAARSRGDRRTGFIAGIVALAAELHSEAFVDLVGTPDSGLSDTDG